MAEAAITNEVLIRFYVAAVSRGAALPRIAAPPYIIWYLLNLPLHNLRNFLAMAIASMRCWESHEIVLISSIALPGPRPFSPDSPDRVGWQD